MKYTSSYDIVKDIIEKLGGDSTIKFSSVYQQAKYIAEMYGADPNRDWSSTFQILLYIYHNFTPPTPETKVTVTFNILDAEGTAPAAIKVEPGTTIILPGAETFEKPGYNFTYWRHGEIYYQAGDEFTVTEDYNFVAVYEEKEAYKGLTFTALEDSAIAMNHFGGNAPTVQYSLDLDNWNDWDGSEIQLAAGDKIGFRADGITKTTGSTTYSSFATQGNLTVEGDITSLVDNGEMTIAAYPSGYNFRRLFYQCEAITDFTKLDMSRLKPINRCYIAMFDGCNNMLYPPKLYAGNGGLGEYCYNATFVRCHGLLEMPELPDMNLGDDCYEYMFSECTALTEMKALPATTLKTGCYSYMFNGCTALNKVSDLPAATIASRCYYSMFAGCTSLEESPVIYAVSNNQPNAMVSMFDGCKKLKKITTYFTGFGSTTNTSWVRNVAATGDYYNLGNAPVSYGVNRMPTNWTVHSEL